MAGPNPRWEGGQKNLSPGLVAGSLLPFCCGAHSLPSASPGSAGPGAATRGGLGSEWEELSLSRV